MLKRKQGNSGVLRADGVLLETCVDHIVQKQHAHLLQLRRVAHTACREAELPNKAKHNFDNTAEGLLLVIPFFGVVRPRSDEAMVVVSLVS